MEYSTENRMTSNNLSICIGNSLLFCKDHQSLTNQSSLSTNYTNGSILLELFLNHHTDLFPTMTNTNRNTRIPPDLIPTEFHSVIEHFFDHFFLHLFLIGIEKSK